MSEARDNLVRQAGRLLGELRAKRPLVQNITNFVSMDIAANVLLAVGASPAMVHAPEESPDFLTIAQALVINIGTLSSPWVESMEVAAKAARSLGKPWVLDPVGAGATGFRDSAVKKLIAHRPQVIRGNASEIMAVARVAGLIALPKRKILPALWRLIFSARLPPQVRLILSLMGQTRSAWPMARH